MNSAADRIQQLQNEQLLLRNLLDSVSEFSKPHVQELIDMVTAEIERELKAFAQAA